MYFGCRCWNCCRLHWLRVPGPTARMRWWSHSTRIDLYIFFCSLSYLHHQNMSGTGSGEMEDIVALHGLFHSPINTHRLPPHTRVNRQIWCWCLGEVLYVAISFNFANHGFIKKFACHRRTKQANKKKRGNEPKDERETTTKNGVWWMQQQLGWSPSPMHILCTLYSRYFDVDGWLSGWYSSGTAIRRGW